jgi:hypothetical protein
MMANTKANARRSHLAEVRSGSIGDILCPLDNAGNHMDKI